MTTGVPVKRKPIVFKRRAGPGLAAAAPALHADALVDPFAVDGATSLSLPTVPTALTASTTSTASMVPEPSPAAAPDTSVDLFRRAKFFYPKAVEDSNRDAGVQHRAAEPSHDHTSKTTPKTTSPSLHGVGESRTSHDPKRRKVSYEQADHGGSDSGSDDSRPTSAMAARHDKGKGIATAHSVNAQVVFADASPQQQPPQPATISAAATSEDDDSVIVLDDDDDKGNGKDNGDGDSGGRDNNAPSARERRDSWEIDDPGPLRSSGVAAAAAGDDDDDDDDDVVEPVDPEFEEYIIRARARDAASRAAQEARQAMDQLARGGGDRRARSTAAASEADDASVGVDAAAAPAATTAAEAAGDDAVFYTACASPTPPPPPPGNQHYRIFITSRLPHEVPPLIANVRMDQEMRHVRNAYLQHARDKGVPLTDAQAASVLLTWKGNKIYNFTTGLSLKIRPDSRGRFRDDADALFGLAGSHGDRSAAAAATTTSGSSTQVPPPAYYDHPRAGFLSGGLHLEIWTEALYEQHLQDQERRRRRDRGEILEEDLVSSDDEGGGGSGGHQNQSRHVRGGGGTTGSADAVGDGLPPQPSPPPPQHQQPRIRLVLKSRDYDKLNLTARGDTTVDTLITAFRIQRQVGPDKAVTIWLDGEQLDGDSTVADADMEDMDSVEVHVH